LINVEVENRFGHHEIIGETESSLLYMDLWHPEFETNNFARELVTFLTIHNWAYQTLSFNL